MYRADVKRKEDNKITVNSGRKGASHTRKVVYCGVMTALMAALSQVALPLPSGVPVTLQTFAVALCGYFGGIWSVVSIVAYLILGLVGVPVFASFRGGISAIVGPTGGFLVGFIPMIILCSIRFKSLSYVKNIIARIVFGVLGLICLHVLGVLWFSFQSGNGFIPSLLLVSVPYLLKDVISVVGGYFLAEVLNRRLKNPMYSANTKI